MLWYCMERDVEFYGEQCAMKLLRVDVEGRADERGYDPDWILPCFVKDLGDGYWEVDVDHERYPRERNVGVNKPEKTPVTEGPGTELKKLLAFAGIKSSPSCKCNARARTMDTMEAQFPGWCLRHIDTILGWLKEESSKRKIPFIPFAAEQAVKLSIRRAQKKATKQGQEGT
jgi:hypothetical protein